MTRQKISKEKREKVRELRNKDPPITFEEIGNRLGISSRTAYKYSKKLEDKESDKVKCELDISPKKLAKVLYFKAKDELNHKLIRSNYIDEDNKTIDDVEDFRYLKRELEEFLS